MYHTIFILGGEHLAHLCLITNSSDISIQLFEYGGNNPVKSYSDKSYTVLIQDKDGERIKLRALNYSERLSFNQSASKQVHNALMKGETIKFKIIEIDAPTTEYKFTIQKADWYENAYKILEESYLEYLDEKYQSDDFQKYTNNQ